MTKRSSHHDDIRFDHSYCGFGICLGFGASDFGAWARAHIARQIASAISCVPTAVGSSRRGLRSYVTDLPSAITLATAASSRSAALFSPRYSSISLPERIRAVGLTLLSPLYLGALPWVASNTAPPSPILAPGATPRPPTRPAHRSLTMSPYRLESTSTS